MNGAVASIVLGIAMSLMLGGTAQAAQQQEPDPAITHALAELPGGQVISPTSAVWPELGITYDIYPSGAKSVGSCATGRICAFREGALGGAKATFTGCSTWSTTPFGPVSSVANARTSGWAVVRNAAGATLRTVTYGTWQDVPAGATSIACAGDGISRQ